LTIEKHNAGNFSERHTGGLSCLSRAAQPHGLALTRLVPSNRLEVTDSEMTDGRAGTERHTQILNA